MSHWTRKAENLLDLGCREIGIYLSADQLSAFNAFADFLLETNQRFNLTSIIDPCEVAVRHFIDSLTVIKALTFKPDDRVVDIATGAGFPGIPLKIVHPDCHIAFIEATRKKVDFVRDAAAGLGLRNCSFHWGRAEELARGKLRGRNDYALVRALGHLSSICEIGLPFLRIGGRLVAFKGPEGEKELPAGRKACAILGASIEEVHRFALPLTNYRRTLIVIVKKSHSSARYPRSSSLPKRKPLGVEQSK